MTLNDDAVESLDRFEGDETTDLGADVATLLGAIAKDDD